MSAADAPPLLVAALAATLYAAGRGRSAPPLRAAAFYGGVAVVVLALVGPVDTYADELFAVHMAQHVMLMLVAPPLVLLGRPWMRMWQPIPLGARRAVAGGLARSSWAAPLRALGRAVSAPWVAWGLMEVAIAAWHLPSAYDATLASQAVHDLEHLTFVVTAFLFWGKLIDSPPFRTRLSYVQRAVYAALAMIAGWVLALVLAFSPHPLYSHYVELAHRPGGLSALSDQQIAAGVMWVPGSVALFATIVISFYRWLDPTASRRARRHALPSSPH